MAKRVSGFNKLISKVTKQADGDGWLSELPTKGEEIDFSLPHKAVICATGLALPRKMSIEQWREIGDKLLAIHEPMQWAIGDYWAYGDFAYGEKAKNHFGETHYAIGTLMNLGSISRKVPPSSRNENLSHSHHKAVVKLHPSKQVEWLKRAEDDGLSVVRLREAIERSERKTIEAKKAYAPDPEAVEALEYIEGLMQDAKKARPSVSRIKHSHLGHLDEDKLDKFEDELSETAGKWVLLRDNVKEFRRERDDHDHTDQADDDEDKREPKVTKISHSRVRAV